MTKIVCISDTHGQHGRLQVPDGDIVVHSGDMTSHGYLDQFGDFLDWFSSLPHSHKILIAGNHDFCLDPKTRNLSTVNKAISMIPNNVHYLNDTGITVGGINFWGSPIQPWFFNWAFNRFPGNEIMRHWNKIPEDTDILITHGPPWGGRAGITKRTGEDIGCRDLTEKLKKLPRVSHVICGHIHEGYGIWEYEFGMVLNCSVLDVKSRLANSPIVFELENETQR